ncbi:hypothetical protein HN992_02445 [Candidatus Woesearchaeota archaeon]|jgi:hypothetical protein|nr:hypothetical protein [Candidatus Woesearchaeota archaeon]MBT3439068.1 hypothetical protein [Candidatus Woesearchaeota archaeon]MBT4058609.1 hypothetical protein [Candidatus Woesearchaeota archaeon]MBT4207232.1 hypothetical protein [Candidatus Woesearchaeota archaeon]MBT4731745.1 hypothetical protein [Candidatus Woesearchaeota archaeon]
MRDDEWLNQRFEQIWQLFFPDVEKKNIAIRWKGHWKNKFGHITTKKDRTTEIAINKIFQNLEVPEDVIKLTIAHEIVHYSHGFHSHLPRKYRHPHKGGVVDKDLKTRGFSYMLKKEKEWQKAEWYNLYREITAQRKANQPTSKVINKKNLLTYFKL